MERRAQVRADGAPAIERARDLAADGGGGVGVAEAVGARSLACSAAWLPRVEREWGGVGGGRRA